MPIEDLAFWLKVIFGLNTFAILLIGVVLRGLIIIIKKLNKDMEKMKRHTHVRIQTD